MALPLADDTPLHIEAEIITLLRALSPVRKLELARAMNRMADRLALAGIQRRSPGASLHELGFRLALQRLTPDQREHGATLLRGVLLMPIPVAPLALALRIGSLLEAQTIPYIVVGSVAAVVHGEYRTTRDIDLVLNLAPADRHALMDALREEFTFLPSDSSDALLWLSEARANVQQRASFCAYDKATGFQIDFYLSSGHPFEVAQFQRAQLLDFSGEPGGVLRVASAEDTILAKLERYMLAPSDHQWRDVQAILRVQDQALDVAYLRRWADLLGLADLLEWALKGRQPPRSGDTPHQQRLF
jgi:hypothetical protein